MPRPSLRELVEEVRFHVSKGFSHSTALPGSASDAPSSGHCAAASIIVASVFGGSFVSTYIKGTSHWFNRVHYAGVDFDVDITADQFGLAPARVGVAGSLYPLSRIRRRSELNEDTLRRASLLRSRVSLPSWARMWEASTKGDQELRLLFDGHYTRQTPGSKHWLRPGFNYVLRCENSQGVATAVFVWWRPKWEDGRPGCRRKDGLKVVECTVFHRRSGPLASDLVREAVAALTRPEARSALHLDTSGDIDALITGVGSAATSRRRSRNARAGHCFRMAGWRVLPKKSGRADVWLQHPWPLGCKNAQA